MTSARGRVSYGPKPAAEPALSLPATGGVDPGERCRGRAGGPLLRQLDLSAPADRAAARWRTCTAAGTATASARRVARPAGRARDARAPDRAAVAETNRGVRCRAQRGGSAAARGARG